MPIAPMLTMTEPTKDADDRLADLLLEAMRHLQSLPVRMERASYRIPDHKRSPFLDDN